MVQLSGISSSATAGCLHVFRLTEALFYGVGNCRGGVSQCRVRVLGVSGRSFPLDGVFRQASRTDVFAVYRPHCLIMHTLAPCGTDPADHKLITPSD
jgi:hypothetical protein